MFISMMLGKGNIYFKKMLLAASSFAAGKEGSSTHPGSDHISVKIHS
jgi:hypothetical protein